MRTVIVREMTEREKAEHASLIRRGILEWIWYMEVFADAADELAEGLQAAVDRFRAASAWRGETGAGREAMTEPVNWDRWHELIDLRAERPLSPTEVMEYLEFAEIAKRLDAEESKVVDAAMDKLVKKHERVIPSIRRATEAVEAAARET